LGLNTIQYTVSFQSRLGKTPWIKPYTDEMLHELSKKGIKHLAIACPSFVADCLETIYEIGTEYEEIFKEHGGEKITLVGSLNANDEWVSAIKEIVSNGN
jgi:ferrochelatase